MIGVVAPTGPVTTGPVATGLLQRGKGGVSIVAQHARAQPDCEHQQRGHCDAAETQAPHILQSRGQNRLKKACALKGLADGNAEQDL